MAGIPPGRIILITITHDYNLEIKNRNYNVGLFNRNSDFIVATTTLLGPRKVGN